VITAPTFNGTSILNFDVSITKPGDMVEYQVDVVNAGTIDAKLETVTITPLCTLESTVESCDWNNDGNVNQEDINKIKDNVSFTISKDGANVSKLKPGEILKAGTREKLLIDFMYYKEGYNDDDTANDTEGTELPKRNLKFNDLNITLKYVQA